MKIEIDDITVIYTGFNQVIIKQGKSVINTSPSKLFSALQGMVWIDEQHMRMGTQKYDFAEKKL